MGRELVLWAGRAAVVLGVLAVAGWFSWAVYGLVRSSLEAREYLFGF